MTLTPLGAQVGMRDPAGRALVANRLLQGQDDISRYIQMGMCYDAAAYVRYVSGAAITPDEIIATNAQGWLPRFDFLNGAIWQGGAIPAGTAVGFERLVVVATGPLFHGAIAIGGTRIRGVNGNMLGPGWLNPVNLADYVPGQQGWFNYDHAMVRARLSTL